MAILADVKTMLGISTNDTDIDSKLDLIIRLTNSRLKVLLGGVDVPESLEYIVTEVSIIRFNKIGSEGLSAHSVEGESLSFSDDDFAAYKDEIRAFIAESDCTTQKGGFKFL